MKNGKINQQTTLALSRILNKKLPMRTLTNHLNKIPTCNLVPRLYHILTQNDDNSWDLNVNLPR